MILTILTIVLGFLTFPSTVFAADPPILTSPSNNSTISSIPTFSWQALSGSTGYNILIDDEPTVTSPYAKIPYYPTNPSYSPKTLNPGTYYWKVKAKDSSGNWGSFSNIWSFTLVSSDPTPTTTSTPNSTPSPSSSGLSTSSTSSSSFTISDPPSQINSDQSFTISVNLSLPDSPNANFYLKGAFKKQDGSNYFGLTKVSGNWVKNSSSYTSQYLIKTDSSGNWSGTLEVKPDADDSGYTGTDDYIFKVGRYTSSGSGPTWSNESTIKIIATSTQNTVSETSSKTSGKTSNSPANSNPSSQVAKTNIANSVPTKSSGNIKYRVASVAGVSASTSATPSATAEVKNERRNFIPWIGGALILCGIGSLGYIYLRNRKII